MLTFTNIMPTTAAVAIESAPATVNYRIYGTCHTKVCHCNVTVRGHNLSLD